jgi:hypothetical protein
MGSLVSSGWVEEALSAAVLGGIVGRVVLSAVLDEV